jgi:hypothetical protein
MGRQIKRVALDFDWILDEPWKGFINPYYEHCSNCPKCDGDGYSPFALRIHRLWYGYDKFKPEDNNRTPYTPNDKIIRDFATQQVTRSPEYFGEGGNAIFRESVRLCEIFNSKLCCHLNQDDIDGLIEAGDLQSITHRKLHQPTEEEIRTCAYYLWVEAGRPESDGSEYWNESVAKHSNYLLPYSNGSKPTADEVNAVQMGAFGISNWGLIQQRCRQADMPVMCAHCNGTGNQWDSVENQKMSNEWESYEPPAGEGYQCWETVSEGSPISPVFKTPEELATYMVSHPWGAMNDCKFDDWLKFINGPGWAPSTIIINGQMKSGVKGMVDEE